MSTIQLYEFGPSRSARVRWTLLELDVEFESIEGRDLFGSEQLKLVHPLSKLPALKEDGRSLFESAAICTWLADRHADKGLIAPSGTWERALHDQWAAFTLSELEAHLWSTARNTFVYPEDRRVPEIFDQNSYEAKRSVKVIDDQLAGTEYLVANAFLVTDIIAGYAINWARRAKLTEGFSNVQTYVERLLERPLCTLANDS